MNQESQIAKGVDRLFALKPGQVAMFGYGSLLSKSSMELTLGRGYSHPCAPCSLDGWRRSWNVMMPNTSFYEASEKGEFVPRHIIYLNLILSQGTATNGLLYVVEPEQLQAFDRREWIYDRVIVTDSIRGAIIDGGEAYAYVAKPEWLLKADCVRDWAAVRQSYVNVIETGLGELGPQFRLNYEASTDPVPPGLIFADCKREGTHPFLAELRPQLS